MKKQPTITYIKYGQEKNVKLNFFNKNFILNQIIHYNPDICYYKKMFINEGVEYIHFKDITFDFNNFSNLNQDKGICIFENCTFESYNNNDTINFYDGAYQFINPKFVNIQNIKAKYAKYIHLIQTDELLNKNILMSLDLMAESISLEGEFNLGNICLMGKNIKLGSIDNPTKITIFNYGTNFSEIGHESRKSNIELKNCSIENLDERVTLYFDYDKLFIDDGSLIDTYGDIVLNDSRFKGNSKSGRIITETEIQRQAIISSLKAHREILISKIDKKASTITTNKLQYLENNIITKNEEVDELKKNIEAKEQEIKNLHDDYNSKYEEYNSKIVKSLLKKPTSYLDEK